MCVRARGAADEAAITSRSENESGPKGKGKGRRRSRPLTADENMSQRQARAAAAPGANMIGCSCQPVLFAAGRRRRRCVSFVIKHLNR